MTFERAKCVYSIKSNKNSVERASTINRMSRTKSLSPHFQAGSRSENWELEASGWFHAFYQFLSLSKITWEAEKFDNVSLEMSLRSSHFHEASMLCAAWKMKAKVRTARDTTFRIYYIFFLIFLQALHVSLSISSSSRPVCYKAKYQSSH